MKLHIENDINNKAENIPQKGVYKLHFHNEKSAVLVKQPLKKIETFYVYSATPNNIEKAFDILFEAVLKNEISNAIDSNN